MAEKTTEKTTAAREDPTITSATMSAGDPYPEGTHPARPVSEVSFGAPNLEGTYRDMPDDEKPDASSIAQIQEVPEGWPGS
jgi:hypothetical protein